MRKRQMQKAIIGLVFGLGSGLFPQAKAQAFCCGEVTAAVATLITYLEVRIGTVIMAIKAGSLASTSAQIMSATQNVNAVDAAVQSEYIMRRGDVLVKQRTGFIPPPNECQTATVGSYLGTASSNYTEYANREAQKQLAVGLSSYDLSADSNAIVDTHLNQFAGEQDVRTGRVAQAHLTGKLNNGDLSFDSLIGGGRSDQSPSGYSANQSTYSPAQVTAARRFIENVTNPFKSPTLPKHKEFTAEGKRYLALQYAEAASLSIPQRILTEIMARRMPVADLGTSARNLWAKINPGKNASENTLKALKNAPNAISYNELVELDVGRRYFNPEWYMNMASMNSVEGILKEQVYMQALQLHLLQQIFSQNELLMAAQAVNAKDHTKSYYRGLLGEQLSRVQ